MSKIEIEQVDRIEGEKEVVRYRDLEVGEAFIYPSETTLKIKTESGHLYRSMGNCWKFMDAIGPNEEVIPVDAKIIWAHKGGGE